MLEQERQQRKEEEKAAEKVREVERRIHIAATVKDRHKTGRLISRDRQDADLRMIDESDLQET